MKKGNRSIEIPILNNEYKVIVCWGSKAFVKRIGKKYKYDVDVGLRDNRGTTYSVDECHPIIVLDGIPVTPDDIGTFAHETSHAVIDIFRYIGQNIEKGDEIFAHCVGAVIRKTLSKTRK